MKIHSNKYQFSGGVDALSIAEKYGCPLYVYDFDIVKRQYQRLAKAFAEIPFQINYACKAMTNVSMLKLIRGLGAGLDAVSIQEVKLGLHAGFLPEEILYTPNCVSMEEMAQAVALGVKVNVDNISMLEQFGQRFEGCLLYTSPSPRDRQKSRMPSSA